MKLIKPIKSGKEGIFFCSYCKREVERSLSNGKRNNSCGCMQHSYSHGGTGTRLFGIWQGIRKRCLNSNSDRFCDYGGRGITICDKWLSSFSDFRNWSLQNGYKDDLIIDRKDNDGNYEPDNCRWVTYAKSNQNSRNAKLNMEKADEIRAKYSTKKYSHRQLGKEYDVSHRIICRIVNNIGWVKEGYPA